MMNQTFNRRLTTSVKKTQIKPKMEAEKKNRAGGTRAAAAPAAGPTGST